TEYGVLVALRAGCRPQATHTKLTQRIKTKTLVRFMTALQKTDWSDANAFPVCSGHSSQGVGVSTCGADLRRDERICRTRTLLFWPIFAITGVTVRRDGWAKPGLLARVANLSG